MDSCFRGLRLPTIRLPGLLGRPRGRDGFVVAMKNIRVKVGAVRPNHGAELSVHEDLTEQCRIVAQGLEDRAPEMRLQIDLTNEPVIEGHTKHEVAGHVDAHDSRWSVSL
jgi:hypothetical protein